MTPGARCGTLLAYLVFAVACGYPDRLTGPSSTPPPSTSTPPPSGQPPLTGPATTYLFSGPLSNLVSGYTAISRYVLYENGAFSLHYAPSDAPFPGTYRQEDGRIHFDFGADGSWDASGALNGDLLEVRYTPRMQHSDFDDAVYRRSP